MHQNNNGLYISFNGNTIHRYIHNESTLEQIEDITIEDELISTLKINTSTYITTVEYIENLTELPDEKRYGEIYEDQIEKVVNRALETTEEIMVNDIIMGQLLKTSVLNVFSKSNNGTDMHWLNIMNGVIYSLKETYYILKTILLLYEQCMQCFHSKLKFFSDLQSCMRCNMNF